MPLLIPSTISATELARNLASAIDQVRVRHAPMLITRGNQAIAQLSPINDRHFTLGDLSQLLQHSALNSREQVQFQADLRRVRQAVTLPPSAWED